MKRLKLSLDALKVESFAVDSAAPARGTVRAHETDWTELATCPCTVQTDCGTCVPDSWETCLEFGCDQGTGTGPQESAWGTTCMPGCYQPTFNVGWGCTQDETCAPCVPPI